MRKSTLINNENLFEKDCNFKNKKRVDFSREIAAADEDLDKIIDLIISLKSKKIALSLERLAAYYFTAANYYNLKENYIANSLIPLNNLLAIHDNYTKKHNENVANLAKKIAIKMKLKREEIKKTYLTGLFHDLGKILISKSILNKKGRLNQTEFLEIKKHPRWGYNILKNSFELHEIAEYVLYHHERWDGAGYPAGLRKNEIPLISQIIAAADSWDAMTHDRSYRRALTRDAALLELKNKRGEQFSPVVIDSFLKLKLYK